MYQTARQCCYIRIGLARETVEDSSAPNGRCAVSSYIDVGLLAYGTSEVVADGVSGWARARV